MFLSKAIGTLILCISERYITCIQNIRRHRHTDTQTHRHTDTQTHRHTDTQTHRHTEFEIQIKVLILFPVKYCIICTYELFSIQLTRVAKATVYKL